jgi:hypothetical protein
MEKEDYEKIKSIRTRIAEGDKVSFAERNIVNIYDKRRNTKIKEKNVSRKQFPSRQEKQQYSI